VQRNPHVTRLISCDANPNAIDPPGQPFHACHGCDMQQNCSEISRDANPAAVESNVQPSQSCHGCDVQQNSCIQSHDANLAAVEAPVQHLHDKRRCDVQQNSLKTSRDIIQLIRDLLHIAPVPISRGLNVGLMPMRLASCDAILVCGRRMLLLLFVITALISLRGQC
jgi:hypothetical protein